MKIEFKNYKFTPILGWSSSRYEQFSRCKRSYFYQYYGKFSRDFSVDKINSLKFMTSVPMETGNVIHHVAEALLNRLRKSSAPIDNEKFISYGVQLVDTLFDKKIFIEEYYRDIEKVDRVSPKKRVELALRNFIESPLFSWLSSTALHSRDEWVIEPAGYGETRLDNRKAYCKMDFLLPVDGKIYILDWKSGKKSIDKHSDQLFGYALAVQEAIPNIDINTVIPKIIYLLPELNEFQVPLTADMLNKFKDKVKIQTEEMYNFCSNIEQNIPIDISNFIQTENSNICKTCFYRELCNKI